MQNGITSSAPGKLILTGEHSVVYGEPALIGAISLCTTASIQRSKDSAMTIFSKQLGGCREETAVLLKRCFEEAKAIWSSSLGKNRDYKLNRLRRDPYVVMKIAAGGALRALGRIDGGFRIKIDSELPVGSGLGSSASVAGAMMGAVGRLYGKRWDLERLNRMVFATEKIMHGKPSGGDNTAVVYGGILRFQRKNDSFVFQHITMKEGFIPEIVLVDSGRPEETTGEIVEGVEVKSQKSKVKSIIRKMGKVSEAIISDFRKGNLNADSIRENERLLEELGVVGEMAQRMVRLIEGIGGAAKICGAGGIRKGSGILLVYHDDLEKLQHFFCANEWSYLPVKFGVGGIR